MDEKEGDMVISKLKVVRSENPLFDEAIQKMEKERQQETENLRSTSQRLSDLIVSETFIVEEAISESYPNTYSNFVNSSLTLKVQPVNQIPVRTLYFNGISTVRAGEKISAMIPRYEQKEAPEEVSFSLRSHASQKREVFYFDREYKTEESAIELAVLSDEGKILRKDRSLNYQRFVKIK